MLLMVRAFPLSLICCIFLSCARVTHKPAGNDVVYLYIPDEDYTRVADSITLYRNRPFEKSLELYRDTDSLTQFLESNIYLSIFKLENEKFAVLADSAYTSFYKFMPDGHYQKLYHSPVNLGMRALTEKKDLNTDGYKDIVFTMVSGGSYGDDNLLLFYDPKNQTLVYHEEPELRNIEIRHRRVYSYTKFLNRVYRIEGTSLKTEQKTEYLQQDNYGKMVVTQFDEKGRQQSSDTLPVPENEENW
jgi:hypothetical protein